MSDEPPSEAAARRLRIFAAVYVMYLGSIGVMLAWLAVTTAYFSGDWQVTFTFDRWGEGPVELVLFTGILTLVPLGWMAFHETIRRA